MLLPGQLVVVTRRKPANHRETMLRITILKPLVQLKLSACNPKELKVKERDPKRSRFYLVACYDYC